MSIGLHKIFEKFLGIVSLFAKRLPMPKPRAWFWIQKFGFSSRVHACALGSAFGSPFAFDSYEMGGLSNIVEQAQGFRLVVISSGFARNLAGQNEISRSARNDKRKS